MPSSAGRMTLKTLSRLVAITASHCDLSILRIVLSRVIPALLTMMSRRPKRSSIMAIIAAHWS